MKPVAPRGGNSNDVLELRKKNYTEESDNSFTPG